jgi:hypothetical protein
MRLKVGSALECSWTEGTVMVSTVLAGKLVVVEPMDFSSSEWTVIAA